MERERWEGGGVQGGYASLGDMCLQLLRAGGALCVHTTVGFMTSWGRFAIVVEDVGAKELGVGVSEVILLMGWRDESILHEEVKEASRFFLNRPGSSIFFYTLHKIFVLHVFFFKYLFIHSFIHTYL